MRRFPVVLSVLPLLLSLCLVVGCVAPPAPSSSGETQAGIRQQQAEAGDAQAQLALALCFMRAECGYGKDDRRAAYFLQQAAAQGHAGAQSYLAEFYYHGKGGLPRDRFRAHDLFLKAARQGYPWAQYRLGDMLTRGEGVSQRNIPEGYYWLKAAASQNPPVQRAVVRLKEILPQLSPDQRAEQDARAAVW